jgi:two-component system, cell cycle response regulator DivK
MPKILIAEDDQMNRDMLSQRMRWEGYQVVTAENGAQAVELASLEHPDVILMDMGMPVLNGWQATHRIKTSRDTSTIPIIALTAYARSEDRMKCLNMGCDEYESKPVDFARLQMKIQALLEKRSNVTETR